MYPSKDARELSILLRISRELDVVGDVTATVDNPSELLAWALTLHHPDVTAWRAGGSEHRFLEVSACRHQAPIRGRVTAVLPCEPHLEFWNALQLHDLTAGNRRPLRVEDLSSAWELMPITASGDSGPTESPADEPT